MKTPHPRDWADFFRRLPRWVIPLILALIFGRFVLVILFHLFS